MRSAVVLLLAVLAPVTGCTAQPPPSEPALRVEWREATLPAPPGPTGRLAVRGAARCGGQWYVVGGVLTAGGGSRPAGWRSGDGRTWTNLRFRPGSYYAHRNVISSVACRDGRVAMIGWKSGGAHGNPRHSTWYPDRDGVFVDVRAPMELYGGPRAVGVGPIAAGPTGWMIAGSRISGAAVWLSADATRFRLHDSDRQLSSDARTTTTANHLTYAAGGWTVVGGASLAGRVPRIPMAWVSADGLTWRRQPVPYDEEYADLHRVTPYRDGVLAAGINGDGFGVWRRDGTRWRLVGGFAALDPDRAASPLVSSLTTAGRYAVAVASDGTRYTLWASRDAASWRRVATPGAAPRAGGRNTMAAAGSGGRLLLLADDGSTGRVWLTDRFGDP